MVKLNESQKYTADDLIKPLPELRVGDCIKGIYTGKESYIRPEEVNDTWFYVRGIYKRNGDIKLKLQSLDKNKLCTHIFSIFGEIKITDVKKGNYKYYVDDVSKSPSRDWFDSKEGTRPGNHFVFPPLPNLTKPQDFYEEVAKDESTISCQLITISDYDIIEMYTRHYVLDIFADANGVKIDEGDARDHKSQISSFWSHIFYHVSENSYKYVPSYDEYVEYLYQIGTDDDRGSYDWIKKIRSETNSN